MPRPIIGQEASMLTSPPNSSTIIDELNFKDTDVRDILRSLAFEFKTNIWIDNEINERVSVALYNIQLIEAIKIICLDNNLNLEISENRFVVSKQKQLKPPPPIAKKPYVKYNSSENIITLELEGVEIGSFINELRNKTKKNFLLTKGTSGEVSGRLVDINFDNGVRNILQNNGYYLIEKDSIYFVSRSSYYSSIENGAKNLTNYWVSAEKTGKITIDVKDAELNKIIDDIFYQLDLPIIKLNQPSQRVTVKCSQVSIDRALYYLFKGSEYTFKNENGTYIVGLQSSKNLDNIKLIKLNHLKAETLLAKIPSYFKQVLQLDISIEHNALIVKGQNEAVTNLEEFIDQIDSFIPQVMIEALVVDYNLDNLYEAGIKMGTGDSAATMRPDKWFPGFDVTASGKSINNTLKKIGTVNLFGKKLDMSSIAKLPDDFYMNMRFLEENGIANIRSKPILSTLNGHKATLKIGTTQNYVFTDIMPVQNQLNSTYLEQERIQEIEAMVSFEITPWVGQNNRLTLEIKPDFKTPVGEFSPDKNKIPAINTRSLESTIRINDGETIVVGGLIQDIETVSESKVPILGDIPLLGELFKNSSKNKSKAELVIYITPHIFYENQAGFAYYNYAE